MFRGLKYHYVALSTLFTHVSLSAVGGCGGHGNCTLCQSQPECGWCDDGTGTGTGTCHTGFYEAPFDVDVSIFRRAFLKLKYEVTFFVSVRLKLRLIQPLTLGICP